MAEIYIKTSAQGAIERLFDSVGRLAPEMGPVLELCLLRCPLLPDALVAYAGYVPESICDSATEEPLIRLAVIDALRDADRSTFLDAGTSAAEFAARLLGCISEEVLRRASFTLSAPGMKGWNLIDALCSKEADPRCPEVPSPRQKPVFRQRKGVAEGRLEEAAAILTARVAKDLGIALPDGDADDPWYEEPANG